MLNYAVIFFFVALVAALFGFGIITAGVASIAKIHLFVFVLLACSSLTVGVQARLSLAESVSPEPCPPQ